MITALHSSTSSINTTSHSSYRPTDNNRHANSYDSTNVAASSTLHRCFSQSVVIYFDAFNNISTNPTCESAIKNSSDMELLPWVG